ncbi:hypothetical protein [Bdellovibrio sp. HCB337]|uniref:hypothetical protein n=1 Tax=Bdellovibrio sp. HCB337 TaxID=3394358 RepID=UPI0039A6930F
MIRLLCALLLVSGISAFAADSKDDGGWVGMGGELFKDARNPWFVKNTSEVLYCIRLDKKDMSIDESNVETAFNDALQFWKGEFSRAFGGGDGSFQLGQQSFKKVSCDDPQVQLRILFGASLLNADEKNFLKAPENYVGVTVRTAYDLKQLRAKGFMFFSNDLNRKDFVSGAWSRPKILRYALMHELGHVFGLPHIGTGLMSEIFLDQLIKAEYIEKYEDLPVESVISQNPEINVCSGVFSTTRVFFGLPTDHDCLVLKSVGPFAFQVFSKKDEKADLNEIGSIRLEFPNPSDYSGRPVSFLQLPTEQEVFTEKEAAFRPFMIGPVGAEFGASGKFIPKNPGPQKSVYAKLGPSSFSVIGTQPNGSLVPVIQYSSPIGFIYLMPARP